MKPSQALRTMPFPAMISLLVYSALQSITTHKIFMSINVINSFQIRSKSFGVKYKFQFKIRIVTIR